MKKPPEVTINAEQFWHDPYPDLAEMRASNPICFVPQLNATLLTRRDDIFVCEKNTAIFSSDQPGGLMTVLMGENMMRKDGDAHLLERKQAFPALSPRTVKNTGLGSQILSTLGLNQLILLTDNPETRYLGLDAYGIEIVGSRPITEED